MILKVIEAFMKEEKNRKEREKSIKRKTLVDRVQGEARGSRGRKDHRPMEFPSIPNR